MASMPKFQIMNLGSRKSQRAKEYKILHLLRLRLLRQSPSYYLQPYHQQMIFMNQPYHHQVIRGWVGKAGWKNPNFAKNSNESADAPINQVVHTNALKVLTGIGQDVIQTVAFVYHIER